MNHGYGAYSQGCRCETCRAAKAAYMREKRAKAWQDAPGDRTPIPGIKHGYSAYQDLKCRCYVCSLAKANDDAKRGGYPNPGIRIAREDGAA